MRKIKDETTYKNDLIKYWTKKYSFLTTSEISLLNKNKNNCSWIEWYIALQAYADVYGEDWEAKCITECGEECWKESYNDGMEISKAFIEGFSE